MDGVVIAERVGAIDLAVARLHAYANASDTDELAGLVARAQVDELLEQRHKLTRAAATK